ncbi:MAG TPA: hypothetical protein VGJ06_12530 [Candidatus Acidoferrum sp.]|jgi:hypothetical protein
MFSTIELLLYIILPAYCVMGFCAWWIHRRNRADWNRTEPGDLYPGLRTSAFTMKRTQTNIPPPSSPTEPWGAIVEWVLPPNTITVVAFSDGSASLYLSGGGGGFGGQAYGPIRRAAQNAVRVAAEFQPEMQPTKEFPPPEPGIVIFYVLTDSGVFTSSAFAKGLANKSVPLFKLGDAMQEIVTAYRTTRESATS